MTIRVRWCRCTCGGQLSNDAKWVPAKVGTHLTGYVATAWATAASHGRDPRRPAASPDGPGCPRRGRRAQDATATRLVGGVVAARSANTMAGSATHATAPPAIMRAVLPVPIQTLATRKTIAVQAGI